MRAILLISVLFAAMLQAQTNVNGAIQSSAFNLTDGSSILLYENFSGGFPPSHQYSASQFNATAGTLGAETYPTADVNHPALIEFATGAAGGNDGYLIFGTGVSAARGTPVGPLNATTAWEYVGVLRLPSILTIGFKFCLMQQSNAQQGGATFPNGACFRFDTSTVDTTWRFITEAASVATNVDTTVTVLVNTFYKLRIYSTVSGTFAGDVTPAGGSVTTKTSNTNIPTVALTPCITIINRGVVPAVFDISGPLYFDQTGLTRP